MNLYIDRHNGVWQKLSAGGWLLRAGNNFHTSPSAQGDDVYQIGNIYEDEDVKEFSPLKSIDTGEVYNFETALRNGDHVIVNLFDYQDAIFRTTTWNVQHKGVMAEYIGESKQYDNYVDVRIIIALPKSEVRSIQSLYKDNDE
jgi:hypothetical protein